MTQHIARTPISTRIFAMCIDHVLPAVLYDLMHLPRQLHVGVERAIEYLSRNARRAHPRRDQTSGRLKLGLVHVYAGA